MSENEVKPITTLVLYDGDKEIKIEKSLEEIKKMMFDEGPFLAVQDLDGLNYLLPKLSIKIICSDNAV
jgi:hypothetical protein